MPKVFGHLRAMLCLNVSAFKLNIMKYHTNWHLLKRQKEPQVNF